MHKKLHYRALTIILISFLFIDCTDNSSSNTVNDFKEVIDFNYAKGISIYKTNEGHVVTISNPATKEVLDHFLVTELDETNLSNIRTVKLPIHNVLAYSSTYISFLDALGETNTVKGVTYSQGIQNAKIKEQLANKSTIDVGSDQEPDKELIVSLSPDLALIYPSNGNHDWFSSFDIPTITNVEYLETHPLAQAEWIKLYGVLFNKFSLADSLFNTIEQNYLSIKNQSDSATSKPVILCGELYDNTWSLPGGKSLTSQLISDAGGEYFMKNDTSTGSKKVDFEYILANDSGLDFWLLLTYNNSPITYNSLKINKPRYSYLSLFKPENIGICNTAISPYFETSILEPHVLLSEIRSLITRSPYSDSLIYFKPLLNE